MRVFGGTEHCCYCTTDEASPFCLVARFFYNRAERSRVVVLTASTVVEGCEEQKGEDTLPRGLAERGELVLSDAERKPAR